MKIKSVRDWGVRKVTEWKNQNGNTYVNENTQIALTAPISKVENHCEGVKNADEFRIYHNCPFSAIQVNCMRTFYLIFTLKILVIQSQNFDHWKKLIVVNTQ